MLENFEVIEIKKVVEPKETPLNIIVEPKRIRFVKAVTETLGYPPYVCNGCQTRNKCSLEKSYYSASVAQKEYEKVHSESRSGVAISEEERRHLPSSFKKVIHSITSL